MARHARIVAHHRRREAGAIHIMAALGLVAAVLAAALAIDLGRIAWDRRQVQVVADLAAMDALRAFGPCTANPTDPTPAAQASALRNGFDGNLANAPNAVTIGEIDTVAGVREFTPGGLIATATAVRVQANQSVPLSLVAGALLPGQATLRGEAVARRVAVAGLRAGSFLARFDPPEVEVLNGLLGGMLGTNLSVSALSYENLLGANVSLGELIAAEGSVGSLDEFLDLNMTAGEYLEMTARALDNRGETDAAATLNDIAALSEASATLHMGDLLSVSPLGEEAALDAVLNAFDMLNVGAQVARGDAAILIDPLAVTIPGVSTTQLRVKIVQTPQIAIGPPGRDENGDWQTLVRTGQVRMELNVRLLAVLGILGSQPISLDVFAEAAPTNAYLKTVDCASADDPVHHLVVGADPGVVRLGIGRYPDFDTSPDPVPSQIVRLRALLPIADVTASADIPFQSAGVDLDFDGPFFPQIPEPSPENTQTVGTPVGDALTNAVSTMIADADLDIVLLGALPLPVPEATVFGLLVPILDPVMTALDGTLTATFESLGIHLGGADVTVLSLNADRPTLVR